MASVKIVGSYAPHDPLWNDEKFPSMEEIYRSGDDIIEFNQRTKKETLSPFIKFIDFALKDKDFQNMFDMDVLRGVPENMFAKIISLMKVCAIELFEKTLLQVLNGRVSESAIWNIAAACVTLSVKLYGSDWIYAGETMPSIEVAAQNFRKIDNRIRINRKIINIMERDILHRTDWKGCPTYYLNRTYDPMFPGMNREPSDEDYTEMSKRGSSMIKDATTAELIYGYNPSTRKLEYMLKCGKRNYNNEQAENLPLEELNVVVDKNYVDKIASVKNITRDEAFVWLRDRVLGAGFEMVPLSFSYKMSFRIRRKTLSRKSLNRVKHSKSTCKSARKSRKTSRKSARKSRKSARKSRKSARKSRKSRKSARKSRKSRKSARKSRKSRKSARKSRKSARKSRK
jgi:hypothetical protein